MLDRTLAERILGMSTGILVIEARDTSKDNVETGHLLAALQQGGRNGLHWSTSINTAVLTIQICGVPQENRSFVVGALSRSALDFKIKDGASA